MHDTRQCSLPGCTRHIKLDEVVVQGERVLRFCCKEHAEKWEREFENKDDGRS